MVHVVIGLGETGKPLYEIIKESGQNVIGVDVQPVKIEEPVEIMHICLRADDEKWLIDVIKSYSDQYNPKIICIHSTVVPGVSKKVQELTGKPVAHSPVKGIHKRMKEDLKYYTKYIGSDDVATAHKVAEHLSKAGLKTKTCDSFAKTEWLKPLETTYYGVLIGWAQEVYRLSKEKGFDFNDYQDWNKEIEARGVPRPQMTPGIIGGHCVMPNIKILKKLVKSKYLDAVEESNEWVKENSELEN